MTLKGTNINLEMKNWEENNQQNAFIDITDFTRLENQCQFTITHYDIMNKAHIFNVYSDLNWDQIYY